MRLRAAAAATLFVLIGLVVLALASASAQIPPDDLAVTFDLVEDSDNIVAPGETIRPRLTFTHSYEFDPQGAPPPTLTIGPDSTLRIAGPFRWERRGRGSAAFPGTSLSGPRPLAIGSAGELSFSEHGSLFQAKALDGRTLATTNREGTNNVVVRVIDTSTMTLFDTVSLELGRDVARPASPRRFAVGSSVAVWQEDGVTAWIFIGSPGDRHSYRSLRDVGSVWIYKVDYSAVDAADRIVRAARLIPNEAEIRNNRRHRPPTSTTGTDALYGSAVAVSADGGALVVGAPRMNEIGAAYVYERPAAGWGALTYDDGIKLSPVEILNRSDGSHYEGKLCNGLSPPDPAWPMDRQIRCTRWWSMDNSQYGSAVSLSADGGVIAVGAYGKDEKYDTYGRTSPGGSPGTGEVFVFVEPDDSWDSVAQANDGNPGRYGPSRRITRPDRILRAQVWGETANNYQHFGKSVSVSPSGAAIAAGAPGSGDSAQHSEPGKVHVFRMPAGGWRDATPYEYNTLTVSTNETVPDADLSTTVASSQQAALLFGSHVSWNGAGDRLYVSSPNYHYPAPDPNPGANSRGRGFVFPTPSPTPTLTMPACGRWSCPKRLATLSSVPAATTLTASGSSFPRRAAAARASARCTSTTANSI